MEAQKSKKDANIDYVTQSIDKAFKAEPIKKPLKRLNMLLDLTLSRPCLDDEKFIEKIVKFIGYSEISKNESTDLIKIAHTYPKEFMEAFDKFINSNVEYISTQIVRQNYYKQFKSYGDRYLLIENVYEVAKTPWNLVKKLDLEQAQELLIPIVALYDKNLMETAYLKYISLDKDNGSIGELSDYAKVLAKYNHTKLIGYNKKYEPPIEITSEKKSKLLEYISGTLSIISNKFINYNKIPLLRSEDSSMAKDTIKRNVIKLLEDKKIFKWDFARNSLLINATKTNNPYESMYSFDYIVLLDFYIIDGLSKIFENMSSSSERAFLKQIVDNVINSTFGDLGRAKNQLKLLNSIN